METPQNLDAVLRSMLKGTVKPGKCFSAEDRAFAQRMVEAVDSGSKGVFVVINADNSMDYFIANVGRVGATQILGRMIEKTARLAQEEDDPD